MSDLDLTPILAPGIALREAEPHILSVYAKGEEPGSYDQFGVALFYDKVMCNPLYNRIMWGYRLREYIDFVKPALNSSPQGWVLDVACGALAFTEGLYADYSARPVVLLDQSLNLLRKAKAGLEELKGGMPPNLALLHADALDLPFQSGVISTIISLNLIHCLEDIRTVIGEWKRVLAPGGSAHATTLVRNRWWGDGYLGLLSRTEQMFSRNPEQVSRVFGELDFPHTLRMAGNLALFNCRNN